MIDGPVCFSQRFHPFTCCPFDILDANKLFGECVFLSSSFGRWVVHVFRLLVLGGCCCWVGVVVAGVDGGGCCCWVV